MKSPVSTYKSVFTFMLPRTSVQSGFTLIEMMVVVLIIAILAAIAIPSYRQYIIRNVESQAQAKMKQLQLELETWRANNLTYRGFLPKQVSNNGTVTYAYTAGQTIDVAMGSNGGYTITLGDMSGNSLVPSSNSYSSAGNAWQMIAVPYGNLINYGANKFSLNSTGLACKSVTVSFTPNMTSCATGATSW